MKRAFIGLLTISVVLCLMQSCSRDGNLPRESKTFVLVHGAWQASWVWGTVKQQLELVGQKVIVVSLPAHGDDPTSPTAVTLDSYRDAVISAISNKTVSNKKIVLVGHSLAGMIISEVAEKIPNQIDKLIYVGAYLPTNGQSLLDLANTDGQSLLGQSLIFYPATLGVPLDKVPDIFCQDGSEEVKNLLVANYKDEPAIPFTNKATLTDANFGKADKFYIHTLQDHVVGPDLQNRMIDAAHIPNGKVYSLNSSHSPFLSMPDKVSETLLKIAFQ
jgi:pimeloyl-ACP methyl ester carboxylesterase